MAKKQERAEREKRIEPAMGMVQIANLRGGGQTVHGSSLIHHETIEITISQGSIEREHHEDRYRTEERLIKIEFSPLQFAHFITSQGWGPGVPCTIKWRDGKPVPPPKHVNKHAQFHREFREQTQAAAAAVDTLIGTLKDALTKPSVSKATLREVLAAAESAKRDLGVNAEFTAVQFQRTLDNMTAAAKADVEAFVAGVVREAGLRQLGLTVSPPTIPEDQPMLEVEAHVSDGESDGA